MSIVDIAKAAGVSKSTVSRVINGAPGVRSDVVRRVREVMERLGYHPSARRPGPKPSGRRGIRTGNVLLLALGQEGGAIPQMPAFPGLLRGLEGEARAEGLNLIVAGMDREGPPPAALAASNVDGVLLVGDCLALNPAARSRLDVLPAVGLMRGFDELKIQLDRVLYDTRAVGVLAARHLVDAGHRHLAYLNADPGRAIFAQRQHDFAAAAAAAGATVVDVVAPRKPHDVRSELQTYGAMVDELLAASPVPGGLFVPAVAQLAQLDYALNARGLRPGRELMVIACENESGPAEPRASAPPTAAIIDLRLQLVGRRGIRELLWRMANPEEKGRVTTLIEPALVPAGRSAACSEEATSEDH